VAVCLSRRTDRIAYDSSIWLATRFGNFATPVPSLQFTKAQIGVKVKVDGYKCTGEIKFVGNLFGKTDREGNKVPRIGVQLVRSLTLATRQQPSLQRRPADLLSA
jgi:hypothetical protein